jgi:hypothetical protein
MCLSLTTQIMILNLFILLVRIPNLKLNTRNNLQKKREIGLLLINKTTRTYSILTLKLPIRE